MGLDPGLLAGVDAKLKAYRRPRDAGTLACDSGQMQQCVSAGRGLAARRRRARWRRRAGAAARRTGSQRERDAGTGGARRGNEIERGRRMPDVDRLLLGEDGWSRGLRGRGRGPATVTATVTVTGRRHEGCCSCSVQPGSVRARSRSGSRGAPGQCCREHHLGCKPMLFGLARRQIANAEMRGGWMGWAGGFGEARLKLHLALRSGGCESERLPLPRS